MPLKLLLTVQTMYRVRNKELIILPEWNFVSMHESQPFSHIYLKMCVYVFKK